MRIRSGPLPLLAFLLLGACARSPASSPAPDPGPCQDPVYLALRVEHPDSLSERAWERLRQLDAECQAAAQAPPAAPASDAPTRGIEAWFWMPAMMLLGGMMWLMMGPS